MVAPVGIVYRRQKGKDRLRVCFAAGNASAVYGKQTGSGGFTDDPCERQGGSGGFTCTTTVNYDGGGAAGSGNFAESAGADDDSGTFLDTILEFFL